jgi:hypothetical protein
MTQYRTYLDDSTAGGLETILGIQENGSEFGVGISSNFYVSGITTLGVTTVTSFFANQLNVSGVSTFGLGPVLISNTGSATSTGTVSQSLQVTGGAYVSGRRIRRSGGAERR